MLIHLLAAAFARHLAAHPPASTSAPPKIKCVYVRCDAPFPQVETFVEACTERYNLELEAIAGDMKAVLGSYLDARSADPTGKIEAVLVGTRRGDPHGGQSSDGRLGDPAD